MDKHYSVVVQCLLNSLWIFRTLIQIRVDDTSTKLLKEYSSSMSLVVIPLRIFGRPNNIGGDAGHINHVKDCCMRAPTGLEVLCDNMERR